MNSIQLLCNKCGYPIDFKLDCSGDLLDRTGALSAHGLGSGQHLDGLCIAVTPCIRCSSPENRAFELLQKAIAQGNKQ